MAVTGHLKVRRTCPSAPTTWDSAALPTILPVLTAGFLVRLLEEIIVGRDHDQLFIGGVGEWLRRSDFAHRIRRPACDGNPPQQPPTLPGAALHGLRQHHKTIINALEYSNRSGRAIR
ncbi:hypothetical protein [Actinomadura litoris]|uniref:Uncharacterized protein n=1 Tax=Actinomadura litoris TaxID=2678616 RepID=A0A7K1L4T5_9ACTN|nr:hypothetical protein [Actinomadura litoris]MUN39442.1 hypothetical protein [Actinomadura litoris]